MIDLDDVQSMVLAPSRTETVSVSFIRFEATQLDQMTEFLGAAAASVTTVAASTQMKGSERAAVNVGISAAGVWVAGVGQRVWAALTPTFTAGMRRAAEQLGDDLDDWVDEPFDTDVPVHATVLRFGDPTTPALDPFLSHDKTVTWHGTRRPVAGTPYDREPFGFADGISTPVIEGSGAILKPGNGVWDAKAGRWRPVRAGEALLGYVGESGAVVGHPDAALLERNGSYLVIRKLEQDTATFNADCNALAQELRITPDDVRAQIVGRHPDGRVRGCPVGAANPDDNGFLYRGTPTGAAVPRSAHIRRANPRDGMAFADRIVANHMLFRRGYPYTDGDKEGLLFMACCADPRRQFEFTQARWLQDGSLFGLGAERDPLVGRRDLDNDHGSFDIEGNRVRRSLRSYVTSRGGEYFLLPGKSELQLLRDGQVG